MTRSIGTANVTQATSASVQPVLLAKLEFDTPVYAHSGVGTITYGGNDYLGVGDFGAVSDARESELLGPVTLNLTLSGIDSDLLANSMNAGTYGDKVTIYEGYRQADGTLVADPWTVWSGTLDYSQATRGESNVITLICTHDLAVLDEKDGSRFTDEDQQSVHAGDVSFEYVHDSAQKKLFWGGGPVRSNRPFPSWKDDLSER